MRRLRTWPLCRDQEWTRRPGASPPMRMTASWSRSPWIDRIQVCGAIDRAMASSPRISMPTLTRPVGMWTIGFADRFRFPRFPSKLEKRGNARLRPHPHRHHSRRGKLISMETFARRFAYAPKSLFHLTSKAPYKSGHDGLKLYWKPKTIFPGQPCRKRGEGGRGSHRAEAINASRIGSCGGLWLCRISCARRHGCRGSRTPGSSTRGAGLARSGSRPG